jgi:tetratricopeptide (TPR) repeat protein
MQGRRWFAFGMVAVALAFALWLFFSSRNDDSTWSVVVRYVGGKAGWSDSSAAGIFERMEKYRKKGRYDKAISAGEAWAKKNPDSSGSGWFYRYLSALYLDRGRSDREHSEQFLQQAVSYRDRALKSTSGGVRDLQPLESISECVGDLSVAQRCVQYRNSIKILDRMSLLLTEDKDRLARQFKPDAEEHKQVQCLSDWTDATAARVRKKLETSGCQ